MLYNPLIRNFYIIVSVLATNHVGLSIEIVVIISSALALLFNKIKKADPEPDIPQGYPH